MLLSKRTHTSVLIIRDFNGLDDLREHEKGTLQEIADADLVIGVTGKEATIIKSRDTGMETFSVKVI